jgi:aspartate kinase
VQEAACELGMGAISVLKFGGSSFANPAAYNTVARYLARRVAAGELLCVVVSAMSGTTGRLFELLDAITPDALPEDRDAVLGTGEVLASALVRAALVAEHIQAVSLNAFQLGWCASDTFTRGQLISYPAKCISAALQRAQVAVISGGQATTQDGRLVMLGRNSSDLTAIAAAVALGCQSVTIFSDVEGVFTADPYRFANTLLIPRLSYRQAHAYSEFGAKVLYSACIKLAEQHRVRIKCASLLNEDHASYGTEIAEEGTGVQVCLPDNFVVCRPTMVESLCGAANRDSGEWTELLPIVGWPGYVAARLDDHYRQMVAAGRLVTADDLSLIVSFSGDEVPQAYAAPRGERLSRAQAIHDELLIDSPFQEVHRRVSKARGTHSGVFLGSSEAAAV